VASDTPEVNPAYTLAQAEDDLSSTFGQLDRLNEVHVMLANGVTPTGVSGQLAHYSDLAGYPAVMGGDSKSYYTSFLSGYKTGDTGRASTTTLSADPDLTIQVQAGAVYIVDVHLIVSGANGTGNLKWDFDVPSGSTFPYWSIYNTVTPNFVGQENVPSPPAALISNTTGVANNLPVAISGLLTAAVAGTFDVKWAQGTISATNSWMRTGSFIRALRVT
jgi:hypothetical protein